MPPPTLRHRLVLIEGLPGTGKTPTARSLLEALQKREVPTAAFFEASQDNPIAIGSVASDLRGVITAYPSLRDPLADWKALARSGAPGITILESRFIQNAALLLYLDGQPFENALARTVQIASAVRPLNPLLVHLRVEDSRKHIEQVLREDPGDWVERVTAIWSETLWATRLNLSGREAFLEFCAEWGPHLDTLIGALDFDTVTVDNPRSSWPDATGRIVDALV